VTIKHHIRRYGSRETSWGAKICEFLVGLVKGVLLPLLHKLCLNSLMFMRTLHCRRCCSDYTSECVATCGEGGVSAGASHHPLD
jgi:hypothetical protein